MTHEIQTSLEIKLSPDQLKKLEELKAKLQQAAEKANIPAHKNHKPQKPRKVEIDQHINQEGNSLTVDLEAKTFCPMARECFTYWNFNSETGEWEMPESLARLISTTPKVSDDQSNLFKRLGGTGKLK